MVRNKSNLLTVSNQTDVMRHTPSRFLRANSAFELKGDAYHSIALDLFPLKLAQPNPKTSRRPDTEA